MKIVLVTVCLMLFFALQAPVLLAKETKDYRLEADQLYLEHNFKKAYKIYYKLAKKVTIIPRHSCRKCIPKVKEKKPI